LLPRSRGAAPVERALLAGDERTGVCVMALEEGLDTGGIYRRAEVAIGPDDTLDVLRDRLVAVGTDLLVDCLRNGFGPAAPQQGEPQYAAKIDPAELQLDWSEPAARLIRVVRVGRAWTLWRGKRLLVHDAALAGGAGDVVAGGEAAGTVHRADGAVQVSTGSGRLVLRMVQPEGRGRIDAGSWYNGARPTTGECLGR